MGAIREHFEKLWLGELDPRDVSPFTPLMTWEEVSDGVAFVSSFANVTAVRTDAGLVLVDVGSFLLSAQVHAAVRDFSDAPVSHVVYTHGHVDHVFGVERFEAEARAAGRPPPSVIAHARVPDRFRRYERTRGYNACVNARQFRTRVEWPTAYRYPDVTYDERLSLDVGGTRIDLVHARGETDDATWVWIPSRRLLCTGDLFIWCSPNAGNPQKVQRYPHEWAVALRQMAALSPAVLCPGHGVPIWGEDEVREALTTTAALLESLVEQTLRLMNEGARLVDAIHEVKAPAALLARPWLRPVYDQPEFVVRNVWRLYGGWWDGDPTSLEPAPRADVARELAALAGGAERMAARAEQLAERGELSLACHLAELASLAAPGDAGVKRVRAASFAARARAATSLMARGIYEAAAREAEGD
jgi:alkyl sulfatase BDS1-like metallo-beta-lactamase superfamily hydrolase